MRVAWIGGSHTRHLYYANKLTEQFNVVGGIVQKREEMNPPSPEEIDGPDKVNWERHFIEREMAENRYFFDQKLPRTKLLSVKKEDLNTKKSADFIKSLKADVCMVFGVGMIREPLLSALPKDTLNLHLGISPRYRGAATLFWPFYFLEPNWAGVTFHYIVHSPDAGTIVHQCRPNLYHSDGIHDVSCRAVLKATRDVIDLLHVKATGDSWKTFDQKPEAGKNFLESDFKPQHLRMIYSVYENRIVANYLDGKIIAKEPILKDQFK